MPRLGEGTAIGPQEPAEWRSGRLAGAPAGASGAPFASWAGSPRAVGRRVTFKPDSGRVREAVKRPRNGAKGFT